MTGSGKKNFQPPIYLGVAFWGEEFRRSFLDYCMASLLSEGNIPALTNESGKNRFLIYTTPEDFACMQDHPLLIRLASYMQVEFSPILFISEEEFLQKKNPLGSSKMYHVTRAHAAIVSRMYQDQAVGSVLYPDTIYATHALDSSYRHIAAGRTAVLIHFPRLATKKLPEELARAGYLKEGNPLSIGARPLIKAALQHLHVDVVAEQWDLPYIGEIFMEVAWPLPKNSGFLFHAFTMWYIFIDYSKLSHHDTSCLEDNTMDGIYMYRNLKKEEVYFVTDSDECTAVSFSDHIHRNLVKNQSTSQKMQWARQTLRYMSYRQVDAFKLSFSRQPIFFHAEDLTPECYQIEKKAKKVVEDILLWKTPNNFFAKLRDFYKEKVILVRIRLENRLNHLINPIKRVVKIGFIALFVVIKYVWSFRRKDTDALFCIEERHDPNLGGHSLRLKK